ncbi:hypothetical protein TWF281_003310 [Arthrobotrys megalospora]
MSTTFNFLGKTFSIVLSRTRPSVSSSALGLPRGFLHTQIPKPPNALYKPNRIESPHLHSWGSSPQSLLERTQAQCETDNTIPTSGLKATHIPSKFEAGEADWPHQSIPRHALRAQDAPPPPNMSEIESLTWWLAKRAEKTDSWRSATVGYAKDFDALQNDLESAKTEIIEKQESFHAPDSNRRGRDSSIDDIQDTTNAILYEMEENQKKFNNQLATIQNGHMEIQQVLTQVASLLPDIKTGTLQIRDKNLECDITEKWADLHASFDRGITEIRRILPIYQDNIIDHYERGLKELAAMHNDTLTQMSERKVLSPSELDAVVEHLSSRLESKLETLVETARVKLKEPAPKRRDRVLRLIQNLWASTVAMLMSVGMIFRKIISTPWFFMMTIFCILTWAPLIHDIYVYNTRKEKKSSF